MEEQHMDEQRTEEQRMEEDRMEEDRTSRLSRWVMGDLNAKVGQESGERRMEQFGHGKWAPVKILLTLASANNMKTLIHTLERKKKTHTDNGHKEGQIMKQKPSPTKKINLNKF